MTYLSGLKRIRVVSITLLGLVTLGGCNTQESAPAVEAVMTKAISDTTNLAVTAQPTAYAFSMLAPSTGSSPIIYVRIVLDAANQTCPVLTGSDGSSLTTQLRPKNPVAGGAPVTNTNFPVTVCEAVMQETVGYSNTQSGIKLAAVTLAPQHVQVYGDSGCKESDCGVSGASADFQALANLGVAQAHDLILHMGDFNYRGTSGHFARSSSGHKIYAYDAGDVPNPAPSCTYNDTYYSQNAANSPKPDSWGYWKADFFEAAKKLLPTAPWVFARGNHELCSRAGAGWFYFLGPGSSLAGSGANQMQCPDQGDFNNPPKGAGQRVEMIPPYMVALQNFQVWVMDSANACDTFHSNPLTPQYTQQYEQLAKLSANNKATWLMSHRPIWGYQSGGPINNMLQTALANTTAGKLPSLVSLSLAGHMHIYEALTFFDNSGTATGRPPQIVIGNSGVSLGGAPGSGTTAGLDGQSAKYNSAQRFGYMQMSVAANGVWSGQVSDESGSAIVSCNSVNPANGTPICQ